MRKSLPERLSAYSAVNHETGCVEWQRHIGTCGYGMIWLEGKSERAHRAAWIAAHGSITDGLHVLHRCDNRKCINLEHLFIGTNADNVADKVSKNRQGRPTNKGEQMGLAKLTDAKVRLMRMMPREIPNSRWAKEFGVSIMAISMARNRKTWTHVQ